MLCEELECLLGAIEEMPLIVSLLRVLGLIICRPLNWPEQRTNVFAGIVFQTDKIAIKPSIVSPLFNDEGLPVLNNASGIPTVFWLSLLLVTCLRFLPRLFSWWAVKARATLPSAVANSTFFKLGLSFSWENMDFKQKKNISNCIIQYFGYSHSPFTDRLTGMSKCTFKTEKKTKTLCLPAQRWSTEILGFPPLSWPKPGWWASLLLVSMTSQKRNWQRARAL